jgi:hypothetical protein
MALYFWIEEQGFEIELRSPVESSAHPKFQQLRCDSSGQ